MSNKEDKTLFPYKLFDIETKTEIIFKFMLYTSKKYRIEKKRRKKQRHRFERNIGWFQKV